MASPVSSPFPAPQRRLCADWVGECTDGKTSFCKVTKNSRTSALLPRNFTPHTHAIYRATPKAFPYAQIIP